MTLLADVPQASDLAEWETYGATYTVLWDVSNNTTVAYNVLDRPMFVVVDSNMTIRLRMSNAAGKEEAIELMEELLAD